MKVIFLSAGRGTRMLPLTKDIPKALLEIGPEMTIVDSQLESLLECGGITEIVFVVGYKAEMIEKRIKYFDSINVKFIYNPFFATSNNLVSLWMARMEMDEDFVIINGDNVFAPSVLSRLLAEDSAQSITMVIDKKKTYSEEDMKVKLEDNRVVNVSKKIPLEETDGESIGMIRVVADGCALVKGTLDKMIRKEESKQIFYLEAFQQIMNSFPVYYNLCDEKEWNEIDFHPDLDLIRKSSFKL